MASHLTSPDALAAHLAPLAAAVGRLEQRFAACRAALPQLEGEGTCGRPPRGRLRGGKAQPARAIGLRFGVALLLMLV